MKKKPFSPGSARTPQRVLHFVLYYLIRQQALAQKANEISVAKASMKNPSFTPITGDALCLLNTQFAKKPKNPV